MNADEIKALIASLGIDKAVTFSVAAGGVAVSVAPDARIDVLQAQLIALEQRLAALSTVPMAPMADQQSVEAVTRDVATVAKAVQVHDAAIVGIQESLGAFATLLRDAR